MIIKTDRKLKDKREDRITITPVGMVYWYSFYDSYVNELEECNEIHQDSNIM